MKNASSRAKTSPAPSKSLADGIQCLLWIVNQQGPVALKDMAVGLGFEQTRTFRLVRTLVTEGLLRQNRSRKYEAGPAVYSLTAQTLHNSHLIEAALPPLESLRRRLPYRVALGTLWNRKVSYLYHADKKTPIEKAIGGASQWEASNSGVGLASMACLSDAEVCRLYAGREIEGFPNGVEALLARLGEIREAGYAYTPIGGMGPDYANYTLAMVLPSNDTIAIALTGRISPDEVDALVIHLQVAIDQIEHHLEQGVREGGLSALKKIQIQAGS